MTENPAQYVVEVVRDAAGQRPDLLHAPGLLQPGLQPRPLRLHGVPPDGINDGIERHAQEAEFTQRVDATGPSDRLKGQDDGAAVLVGVDTARPSAKPPAHTLILASSPPHPFSPR